MKWTDIQVLLSHLWDIQVDYRASEINGDLIVFLSKGRYQLCTANAIYSFEDRYDNFGNIFRDYLSLDSLPGKNVLVLGLGLGSIPITLDKIDPGIWNFTAVELDPEVCELAALYGYPKIISPIHTIVGDAVQYVASTSDKFDLICIDLFIDDVIPVDVKHTHFLNDVKGLLNDGGCVIANALAFTEEHKAFSQKFFDEEFITVFPEAKLIPTHLNYMLINSKKNLDHQTFEEDKA